MVKATDSTQALVWDAQRKPFGERTVTTAQITMPLGFPGQVYDEETGNYYNYFRDYDPTTGRYLQSDPIGLGGGINTYAYVGGNPLFWVDPKGLNAAGVGVGGAAILFCTRYPAACASGAIALCRLMGGCDLPDDPYYNEEDDRESCPPPGSKPIDETDWSGDHQDIKEGIGAGPRDSTKIDPSDNVWGQNPDGTWTNHGPAGDYTGSGKPSGRRGRDRRRRW